LASQEQTIFVALSEKLKEIFLLVYLPSCLGQETAKWLFGWSCHLLRVKLRPFRSSSQASRAMLC